MASLSRTQTKKMNKHVFSFSLFVSFNTRYIKQHFNISMCPMILPKNL